MRRKIAIVGGAYKHRVLDIDAQDCRNMYVEIDNVGGFPTALLRCPGLAVWAELDEPSVDLMYQVGEYLFVAAGGHLYRYDQRSNLTKVTDIEVGHVRMTDNGLQLLVMCSESHYLVDLKTLAVTKNPGAGVITSGGDVAYMDGYFITSDPGTFTVRWSKQYDGSTWDASWFKAAEKNADPINALKVYNGQLWVFGIHTTEVWAHTGPYTNPFSLIPGAVMEVGCAAPLSVAEVGGSLCWLGRPGAGSPVVVQATGLTAALRTPPAIAHHWSTFMTTEDAEAFSYAYAGHAFYAITFPLADETWEYDFTTGIWNRRTSTLNQTRWRGTCSASFFGHTLIGDYAKGVIYRMDASAYDEGGEQVILRRTTAPLHNAGMRLFLDSMDLVVEGGVGLNSGQGEKAEVMLRVSKNGGHSWGREHKRSLGRIGDHDAFMSFHQLGGHGQKVVLEFSVSDPVRVAFIQAWGNFQQTVY